MKLRSHKLGFSLIELLVTISIITIMTGISIPSFRNYQYKTGLDYNSRLIKNEIQFARSYSLSPPTAYSGSDMFGIKIDPNTKRIIKMRKNESDLTGAGIEIESPIIIAENYSITQPTSETIFYFKIGYNGDLYKVDNRLPSSNVTIKLAENRTGDEKTIIVDRLGMIKID